MNIYVSKKYYSYNLEINSINNNLYLTYIIHLYNELYYYMKSIIYNYYDLFQISIFVYSINILYPGESKFLYPLSKAIVFGERKLLYKKLQ